MSDLWQIMIAILMVIFYVQNTNHRLKRMQGDLRSLNRKLDELLKNKNK